MTTPTWHRTTWAAVLGTLVVCTGTARAATTQPAPASAPVFPFDHLNGLEVRDYPNDDGARLVAVWPALSKMASEMVEASKHRYVVEASLSSEGPFRQAGQIGLDEGFTSGRDAKDKKARSLFGYDEPTRARHYLVIPVEQLFRPPKPAPPKEKTAEAKRKAREAAGKYEQQVHALREKTYYVRIRVTREGQEQPVALSPVVSRRPRDDWFDTKKVNNLVAAVLLSSLILGSIHRARRNPNLFVRKINGLDAVDDAIGRATELGRGVLFVHGLSGMSDISTIAAMNVLSRIATRTAEYDTPVKVVNNDPIVMAVSQETVKEGCVRAGRPDAYNEDNVFFIAADQFSYAASVSALVQRERPGAIFLLGYFYAESLVLAESGAASGAIQIAGTDADAQIPFFITACDYTLIGEELYAASAYLSREPRLLGSLRGQDMGKALIAATLLVGFVLSLFGAPWVARLVEVL